MQPPAIRHFLTEDGRDVFLEWLRRVKGSQDADIGRAVRNWQDWKERTQDERPGT